MTQYRGCPPPTATTATTERWTRLSLSHRTVENHVQATFRKLQVGNWLQLATSPERIEPAKVSWISPISGRLLLVNRRGIRVLVASVEELAAMAKLGKVSVREGETPFEDAMQQVAGRLKTAANQF